MERSTAFSRDGLQVRLLALKLGDKGLEPDFVTTCNNTVSSHQRPPAGAKSGAVGAQSAETDPRLRCILNAWSDLDESTKDRLATIARGIER